MSTKKITISVIVVALVLLIGWDIIVATNNTRGDTISEITLGFAERHVAIAGGFIFTLGFLCGHLFWPQRAPR